MRFKLKKLGAVALWGILVILLGACASKPARKIPESQTLDKLLTAQYDLHELEAFTKPYSISRLGYDTFDYENIVYYSDLDREYPIEVFRVADLQNSSGAYTVYKVTQGGYYYVFWSFAYPVDVSDSGINRDWTDREHMCIYFCTYINGNNNIIKYLPIRTGESTAADVLSLDPNSEYINLSYIRTYSYINEKYALMVVYKRQSPARSNDLKYSIVKEVSIVTREGSNSCIGLIFPEDLPA